MSVDTILHEFIDALYIKHGKNLPRQKIIDKFIDIFISELNIKNKSRHSVTINNKFFEKSDKENIISITAKPILCECGNNHHKCKRGRTQTIKGVKKKWGMNECPNINK